MEINTSRANGPAGNVDLNVSFIESDATVKIEATSSHTVVGRLREKADSLPEISIIAVGGKGERGRIGRNGAKGETGYDGRDATETYNGHGGGPGGKGEDGEPGTDGKPGGSGGNVSIIVKAEDTDTLPFLRLKITNDGGPGGDPGAHGKGGPGGDGGRHGIPYTWSETRKEWVTERYAYPNKDGSYRWDTVLRDVTRTYARGGGERGADGERGETPKFRLKQGPQGDKGNFQICVYEPGQYAHLYTSLYEIRLSNFKSRPVTNNGIHEPGDTIEVFDIEVSNVGGMPTPTGNRVRVSLVTNDGMETNTGEILLKDPIPAGSTVRLPDRIIFTLKEYSGDGKVALADKKSLDLRAEMVRVPYAFNQFTNPTEITLTHPIEIERIQYAKSLLPGEYTEVTFEVKNSSLKDLGPAAAETALQRAIELACATVVTPGTPSSIVFCDAEGNPLSTPLLKWGISKIAPQSNVAVSCHVKIPGAKEDHTAHRIESGLHIQKIGSAATKLVHAVPLQVKEGTSYRPRSTDDFLLVTNLSTSAEELQAWKTMASDLGLSFSVWDPSVYLHMRLSDKAPGGATESLLSSWKNKVIVVLNQGDSLGDIPSNPTGILSQADLDAALRRHNIRLYTVGEPISTEGRPSLLHEVELAGTVVYHDSISRFIASLGSTPPNSDTPTVIEVTRTSAIGFTKQPHEQFDLEVAKLRRYLQRKYPRDTFLILPEFDPAPQGTRFFGKVTKERLGRIEVQREEGPRNGLIMAISGDGSKTQDPLFVQSSANKVGLLASLHSDQLLGLTLKALTGGTKNAATVESLMNAVVLRIASEAGLHLSTTEKHVTEELPLLTAITDGILKRIDDTSPPLISVFTSLMSRLRYLRNQEFPWHQRVFPTGSTGATLRRFDARLDDIERHLQKHLSATELALYQHSMKTTMNYLSTQFRSKRSARFLHGLASHNPSKGLSVSSYNPYHSHDGVDADTFTKRAVALSSAVDDGIVKRTKMVKKT